MAVNINMDKICAVALSDKNLERFSLFAKQQQPYCNGVVASDEDKCYCSYDYHTGYNITLGVKTYTHLRDSSKLIPASEYKEAYKDAVELFLGLFYHELGHTLFTNMGYLSNKLWNFTSSAALFVKHVTNLLEDISIEGSMMVRYPKSIPYINLMNSYLLEDKAKDYLEDMITNKPEEPETFMAYLMHYCYNTGVIDKVSPLPLWDKHSAFLIKCADLCVQTLDATLRAERQLAYAIQLLKILNHQDPDENAVEQPDLDDSKMSQEASNFKDKYGKDKKFKNNATRLLDSTGSYQDFKGPRNGMAPQDLEQGTPSISETHQATLEYDPNGPAVIDSPSADVSTDFTKDCARMLANDDPATNIPHLFFRLKDYKNTSNYLDAYNRIVFANSKTIRKITAVIRKMIAQNNTGVSRYKMTGQFDPSTVVKMNNYKFFSRKNAPNIVSDAVFLIMVDCSGSMHNKKARIAGEALIQFCEVLNSLHIPFAVRAFTQSNSAITIGLKEFDEPYRNCKTNMTLFTEQFDVDKLGTWCCNLDERSLKYCSDELDRQPQKDKILIVISDGATCGSVNVLKQQVDKISSRGTTVLGIGICDDNVTKAYKNHIVLKNLEDLDKLAPFLNNYLVKNIMKKGK